MRIRFLSLCTFVAAIAFVGSTAWAQSSGSFSYGTSQGTGGTTGCILESNGSLSGGANDCIVSNTTGNGYKITADTCTASDSSTYCDTETGVSGSICNTEIGYCEVPSTASFSCKNDNDCLNIFGSNSGATCDKLPGPGYDTCQLPSESVNNCIGSASAGIKTNSGNGNVFDIRPSAVIGLLTDVTISSHDLTSSGIATSSALAGIDFTVSVTPESGQQTPSLTPSSSVTYDARFVQISTNLFEAVSQQCLSLTNGCFLTFAESTVSAHSFDWIAGSSFNGGVPLSSGSYDVNVQWAPSAGFAVSGLGEAAACVGPVNLTVSQNKIFHFNAVNDNP